MQQSITLEVLQFALLLEYLEAEFYTRGINATGLIPAADRAVFTVIQQHEQIHVDALRALISGAGATPITKPQFDFSAGGALPGFDFLPSQYATFMALAMAFEDTGVRAYKGQAARLINDKAALSAALSIHSVEARHASQVRRMRGQKGWITGNSRGDLPAFTQAIYDGEDLTTQGGASITSLPMAGMFGGTASATEAFDEPLTLQQVTAIVTPFLR